jgi:AAA+ superfamily predicted ATPase
MGYAMSAATPLHEPSLPSAGLPWILARLRLRAELRAAWLRSLWAEVSTPGAVSHEEANRVIADRDAPEAEREWLASKDAPIATRRKLQAIEATAATHEGARFSQLRRTFELGPVEIDVLQTCLAFAADPSLGRLFAYLQDHAGRPFVTEPLVARLFGHGRGLRLDAEAALVRWRIVEPTELGPGEPRALVCDPAIAAWLRDEDTLDDALVSIAKLLPVLPPLASWPVDATVETLARALADAPSRVRVAGMPGAGRRTFAAAVAARLGLPALAIDASVIDDASWPELFVRAQRRAFLDRCTLVWHGEAARTRRWPDVPQFPLQFIVSESSADADVELTVDLPLPSLADRADLWCAIYPRSEGWPAAERDALLQQHRMLPGDVVRAARRKPSDARAAAAAIREASRHKLGDLAERLECPFRWDDVVLEAELRQTLDDLVHEAGARAAFWEKPEARRLFPQGRGLLALFTGSPGTGKTMTAQVIAAELGRDLYRIDLSAIVSKWVGETSKNLERVLTRAAKMDVVLLFDEADALFTRRTDVSTAQDRFANTDTNYLLQAVESYDGIALLSSNRRQGIDAAFLRRLRYVLDVPVPDAAQRRELWRRIVEGLAGVERACALDGELDRLAQTVDATGAQIKLAVLGGVFIASRANAPLDTEHLLVALGRELAKDGRALRERARERVTSRGA